MSRKIDRPESVERRWRRMGEALDAFLANEPRAQADLEDVLRENRDIASGFRERIVAGKVDGTSYTGECCCVLGHFSQERRVPHNMTPGWKPYNPIEQFINNIREGDTPENSPWSAKLLEWTDGFLGVR